VRISDALFEPGWLISINLMARFAIKRAVPFLPSKRLCSAEAKAAKPRLPERLYAVPSKCQAYWFLESFSIAPVKRFLTVFRRFTSFNSSHGTARFISLS